MPAYSQSASASVKQPYAESSPDSNIEIDTSVLKGLSQKTYETAPYSPRSQQLHLRKPAPNGNNWLTTGTKDRRSIVQQPRSTGFTKPLSPPTTTPLPITQQDIIIKGRDITAEPHKIKKETPDNDKQVRMNPAPTPSKKPVAFIKAAKAKQLASLPIPKRRPTIQQASRSFVEKKRSRIAAGTIPNEQLVPPSVRKTVPMDPRILQNAPRSMPAEPPKHVIAENLKFSADANGHGTTSIAQNRSMKKTEITNKPTGFASRINDHKNRIIAAVQKIAGHRKEPEIDVNSYMARKEHLATELSRGTASEPAITPRDMKRIDAKPMARQMNAIAPSAGRTTQAVNTAETKRAKGNNSITSVSFAPSQSSIDKDTKAIINAKILPRMQTKPSLRLQIQSYASPTGPTSSLEARRTSLARALTAREYLVSMGINPRSIDLRPMGEDTKGGTADRIDFLLYTP